MTTTRRRGPGGRRAKLAIAALAVAGALGILPAGGAQAAEAPLCGGGLEINNEIPGIDPPGGLSYRINCNAPVLGFGLVSNRQVDYFSTEVLVLDATSGEATPEQFACEGPFPSAGFGCRGTANFGNTISGEFAIGRDPCQVSKQKSDRFKAWVVATLTQIDSVTGKPFTAVTQPFRLKAPDCGKPSKKTEKSNRKEARR